jgi:uncharacterized protein YjbJ (UPF0337 family)
MQTWRANLAAAWRPCGGTTSTFAIPIGGRASEPIARLESRSLLSERAANSQGKQRRRTMNWDTMKGGWKQFRGKVKEQWGKLTDDDLDRIEGKRDQLLGAVQKRYGIARDEAERQLRDFESAHSTNDVSR